jgi:hypothetical protein
LKLKGGISAQGATPCLLGQKVFTRLSLDRFSPLPCLMILACHLACNAQAATDLGNNAALQYLSAFLQMQDANLPDADLKELRAVIAGQKSYDEVKFGSLVEKNTEAIETMIAGTRLERCDWGLAQRGLGPETPVTYFWKARALGRLDILYALRALNQGNRTRRCALWPRA